jgi:hypothetical protein
MPAPVMGVTVSAINARVFHGKRKLRAELTRRMAISRNNTHCKSQPSNPGTEGMESAFAILEDQTAAPI